MDEKRDFWSIPSRPVHKTVQWANPALQQRRRNLGGFCCRVAVRLSPQQVWKGAVLQEICEDDVAQRDTHRYTTERERERMHARPREKLISCHISDCVHLHAHFISLIVPCGLCFAAAFFVSSRSSVPLSSPHALISPSDCTSWLPLPPPQCWSPS